jgi:hypothetical protein
MSYNLHPYQRAHDARDYMTLDMDTLNPYNYKSLAEKMIPYQKEQDMYYFTRQVNPISLVNLGAQWMNPSNFPCDNRQTIYQSVNLNNQERINQFQTPQNNSYLWRDNLPVKAGYYTQNEKLPAGVPRQLSNIQAGKATSFQPFHGMELY